MLHVFSGTDRSAAHEALALALKKTRLQTTRLSDVNSLDEVRRALGARGMFDPDARAIVLDGCFANDEVRAYVLEHLAELAQADDHIFIYEEKPDAPVRAKFERYAAESKKFEAKKSEREDNFFALVNALQRKQKKELWILLQREFAAGKAPEMVHGALFWAAKQLVLKPRASAEESRGKALVAQLAELPHEARRQGEELGYALERFVLSGA